MKLSYFLSALSVAVLSYLPASAEVIFTDSLDAEGSWTVNGTADTAYEFGYDYSADGIPEAPNSVGGAATTGLKLQANMSAGAANIVAASPGLSLSGKYTVQFDMWINANGPFPGGGGGSTEFIGGAVGHDGTTAGVDGASFLASGEGGSSSDWRLYKEGAWLDYDSSSPEITATYGPLVTGDNSASDPFVTEFPGVAPPALQQANFAQQTGSTQDGAAGFQWLTVLVTADADAGTAKFDITSELGGSVTLGTIDASIGDTVSTEGDLALLYADLFSSVSDNAALSFGVFDNVVVNTVPEPSSVVMLLAAAAGTVLAYRRSC
ncbi:PEP-CTERM sorting domain-containing protein [Aeoliella mucimassa]|uniref:PEP-CTERM protein-sorting domain-containing protein n=1 Tax=Aeoliella mucimassa TaxID=2527972 RepID=A0A518AS70_9BACT|nr:PEP-CTERM sorting domain-containing protein [Aeoliella mucimassa]QDU57565.1 hypothetical protein Pan181_37830 [Aeoliella mucimassa]